MAAFKIYMRRTVGTEFRYYEPTAQEAERERMLAVSEKRTRRSEMEKRFLHPALQSEKLFTIMVHKSQEGLAREVLSVYPWFTSSKNDNEGVPIKAIREENLEYDPSRDGPRDEAHQADWDARSAGSTDMLGGKSEVGSTPGSPMGYHYPLPTQDTPGGYPSSVNLPMDNPSTDYLLDQNNNSPWQGARPLPTRQISGLRYGAHQQSPSGDSLAGVPLLSHDPQSLPYPPTSYAQPPIGYTPPTVQRSASGMSYTGDSGGGGSERWETGSDVGSAAPSYTTTPATGLNAPYPRGSRSRGYTDAYGPPPQSQSQSQRGHQDRQPSQSSQGVDDPYQSYPSQSGGQQGGYSQQSAGHSNPHDRYRQYMQHGGGGGSR